MTLPRWMHRLYASLFGYFWMPCPMCGEMFGGHEWRAGDSLNGPIEWNESRTVGYSKGKGVCHKCGPKAHAINVQNGTAYYSDSRFSKTAPPEGGYAE